MFALIPDIMIVVFTKGTENLHNRKQALLLETEDLIYIYFNTLTYTVSRISDVFIHEICNK